MGCSALVKNSPVLYKHLRPTGRDAVRPIHAGLAAPVRVGHGLLPHPGSRQTGNPRRTRAAPVIGATGLQNNLVRATSRPESLKKSSGIHPGALVFIHYLTLPFFPRLELLFSNPYINISLHRGAHNTPEIQWLDFVPSTDFRSSMREMLHLAKQHQVKAWVVDNRLIRAMRTADLAWSGQEIIVPIASWACDASRA